MDERHQEYIDYYRSRVRKYQDNPLYQNSFRSETALYEAISSCQDLNDFRAIIEQKGLVLKNAVALVRDQESARLSLWTELKEPLKAAECEEILAYIDHAKSAIELATTIGEIRQKHSLAQAVDGFVDYFFGDFVAIENLVVNEIADVPARWKNEVKQSTEETLKSGKELFLEVTLPRAREWDPNWKMNYQLVWEDRHRRLIPVPDEVIKRRIENHKRYWGLA